MAAARWAVWRGDGHAVAGEGGDDGGLVAEGPEAGCGWRAAKQAVGDVGEGEGLLEERLGVGEASAEVRGDTEEMAEEGAPGATAGGAAGAEGAEVVALDDEAEVGAGGAVGGGLDGLEAGVAVGE